ncbi:choice-of-anchor U domain-containing protein, partial [Thermus antranikianii]
TACNPIQGAQIQGRTATFQVRDGGPLDADGQANGRIQDPVALGVPAPSPDFSIALNPDALTVPQGGSGTTTLTLTPQNGFTGQVTLTLERQDGTPAPSGIGLSPGSVNVTGSGPVTQTLTVSVGSSVATGSYALRVKATSGDLTRYA